MIFLTFFSSLLRLLSVRLNAYANQSWLGPAVVHPKTIMDGDSVLMWQRDAWDWENKKDMKSERRLNRFF